MDIYEIVGLGMAAGGVLTLIIAAEIRRAKR